MLKENEQIMCQGFATYDAVRRISSSAGKGSLVRALKELFNAYADIL